MVIGRSAASAASILTTREPQITQITRQTETPDALSSAPASSPSIRRLNTLLGSFSFPSRQGNTDRRCSREFRAAALKFVPEFSVYIRRSPLRDDDDTFRPLIIAGLGNY